MCNVSLVIPVYKVEKYIKNSIKSVISQTYSDFEIILVDNNSPDKSIEFAKNILDETNLNYRIVRRLSYLFYY